MRSQPGARLESTTPYPAKSRARNQWILERRPSRPAADPFRPHGWFVESERTDAGKVVPVATVLLTNRECPWKCVMCDLWKTTTQETVPDGAIVAQIDFAFRELGISVPGQPADATPRQLKLYNGGSFFDPRAIPLTDLPGIAERGLNFHRVIVECHPGFVGEACVSFATLLDAVAERTGAARAPQLEVAMGLETAHPEALQKLNKQMTLDQFARAAEFLQRHGIALRTFVLLNPPFLDSALAEEWACRSIEFAFSCGATVVSIIPTRAGNGAMEALEAQGLFKPPTLDSLERVLAFGIGLGRGRVFADLWDLAKLAECKTCNSARRERLLQMNYRQEMIAAPLCSDCGGHLAMAANTESSPSHDMGGRKSDKC